MREDIQAAPRSEASFRHLALLYSGEDEFVQRIAEFVRAGAEADEPVLVVVGARKIERLREALADENGRVCFADMAKVGSNPARIIPAWHDFVAEHGAAGRPFRGVGEPIWAGRSAAELVECQRHEALLNLAFAEGAAWQLLCPYDVAALVPAVVVEARRTHPFVQEHGGERCSASYCGLDAVAAPFDEPLPEPVERPPEFEIHAGRLSGLRRLVRDHAAGAGLGEARSGDLVLAAHEVAANSLRHGGGRGTLRLWHEPDTLICEVRDGGQIRDPLVGRARPGENGESGRGIWLVHHLCDLVQVRSSEAGTVVRLHMRRG